MAEGRWLGHVLLVVTSSYTPRTAGLAVLNYTKEQRQHGMARICAHYTQLGSENVFGSPIVCIEFRSESVSCSEAYPGNVYPERAQRYSADGQVKAE